MCIQASKKTMNCCIIMYKDYPQTFLHAIIKFVKNCTVCIYHQEEDEQCT